MSNNFSGFSLVLDYFPQPILICIPRWSEIFLQLLGATFQETCEATVGGKWQESPILEAECKSQSLGSFHFKI